MLNFPGPNHTKIMFRELNRKDGAVFSIPIVVSEENIAKYIIKNLR